MYSKLSSKKDRFLKSNKTDYEEINDEKDINDVNFN